MDRIFLLTEGTSQMSDVTKEFGELANKAKEVESEFSREKGSFTLYSLDSIDSSQGRWRLRAAAEWIDHDRDEAYRLFFERLLRVFGGERGAKIPMLFLPASTDPNVLVYRAKYGEHVGPNGLMAPSLARDGTPFPNQTTFLIRCSPLSGKRS
jgi:hypothetical protein